MWLPSSRGTTQPPRTWQPSLSLTRYALNAHALGRAALPGGRPQGSPPTTPSATWTRCTPNTAGGRPRPGRSTPPRSTGPEWGPGERALLCVCSAPRQAQRLLARSLALRPLSVPHLEQNSPRERREYVRKLVAKYQASLRVKAVQMFSPAFFRTGLARGT